MATLKESDSRKWINALVAVTSIIFCYICIAFFNQLGEWFELEAQIAQFSMISQFAGIALGFIGFFTITKNTKAANYLSDVYNELTKVIWPDHDSTLKLTISIIVGVAISSVFLGLVDLLVQKVLELLY